MHRNSGVSSECVGAWLLAILILSGHGLSCLDQGGGDDGSSPSATPTYLSTSTFPPTATATPFLDFTPTWTPTPTPTWPGGVFIDYKESGWWASMASTADGNVVLVGTKLAGAIGSCIVLRKVNLRGEIAWTRTFADIYPLRAESVVQEADGGFVIAGTMFATLDTDMGPLWSDACLIKTDATGQAQWLRRYRITRFQEGHGVRCTPDGGYALAGVIPREDYTDSPDLFLIKTDSSGLMLWNRQYLVAEYGGFDICREGGFILAGGGVVTRTDESGNVLWSRDCTIQHYWGGYCHLYGVRQCGDGNFVVVGMNEYHDQSGFTTYNVLQLGKLNAQGESVFQRDLNAAGGRDVRETADGGFIVTCGGRQLGLVKTSGSGVIQWSRGIGPYYSFGRAVLETPDGGFMAAGFVGHNQANPLLYPTLDLVVKTDPAGNLRPAPAVTPTPTPLQFRILVKGILAKVDQNGGMQWSTTFAAPALSWSTGHAVIPAADGGFLVGGERDARPYLLKTDDAGAETWHSFTGETLQNPQEDGACQGLLPADGAGYYSAGYLQRGGEYSNNISLFLTKVDSLGQPQWKYHYAAMRYTYCYGVVQADDGSLLVFGSAVGYDSFDGKAIVSRITNSGTMIWFHGYGGSGWEEVRACFPHADGGFLLVGSTNPGYFADSRMLVLKITADGSLVWSKNERPFADQEIFCAAPLPGGNAILAGRGTTEDGIPHILLAEIDYQGTLLWSRLAGEPWSWVTSITPVGNGRFALTGLTTANTNGATDALVMEIDAGGNTIWSTTLGTAEADGGRGIAVVADGGFVVTGWTMSR